MLLRKMCEIYSFKGLGETKVFQFFIVYDNLRIDCCT